MRLIVRENRVRPVPRY